MKILMFAKYAIRLFLKEKGLMFVKYAKGSHSSTLKLHLCIHTREKPYRQFKHKHLHIHTKEKLYVCKLCNKAFSVRSNLNTHLQIHMKEMPHACKFATRPSRERTI
ncbi:UNVERIFIED_CONTAM: zinc finger protein [Trichonephila clavipes]